MVFGGVFKTIGLILALFYLVHRPELSVHRAEKQKEVFIEPSDFITTAAPDKQLVLRCRVSTERHSLEVKYDPHEPGKVLILDSITQTTGDTPKNYSRIRAG